MNNFKKETRDRPQEQIQENFKKISESIINLYEQKQKDLDGNDEQGAIDFKILILEQYFIMYKDKKELMKKLYQLINKFLKNEVKDIGLKIYKYLYGLVNVHYERITETNIRAYTEFLIYINENSPRILEIWENNNKNYKNEKILNKNSLELLGYYSHIVLYSFQNYNRYLNEHNNLQDDYINELRSQTDKLADKISKALYSSKIIEKEKFSNNYKDFILEKYLFLLIVQLYLFFLLKNKNIIKEEVEFICHTFQFVLKKTENYYTFQMTLKYFEGVLSLGQTKDNADINQYNGELIKNWKNYFDESNYLQNKYKSDNKYNLILKFILKYYLYCFNRQGNNNELVPFFKDLHKNIVADNYIMFKKLISKINDFRISFELKGQIIYLIFVLYDFNSKEKIEPKKFENLHFFMKEITSFYQTLYTLTTEFISSPIKEEKQQQKEIYQKNILKVNIEENDQNSFQKNNINHLFIMLLSNKYDKYIYMEDPKILFDFMKTTFNILKNFIEIFKSILQNKENSNLETRINLINRMAVQLSKFFYFFYYVYERNRVNHQSHEIQSDLIDKLIELYIGFEQDLLIAVFRRLMPYILKLYKFGNKISPIKNSISNKLIHNIFKMIKVPKTREIIFEIYLDFFSMKIYETGNPTELFNSDSYNFTNIPQSVLTESINNISILKSIFFNLLECVENFEYFKNKIIPLILDFIHLSKNSEYYGNYIYILRCFFKYLKSAINQAQIPSNNNPAENNEKRQRLRLSAEFNIEINYILYAIIKYLLNIKEKTQFLSDFISEIIMIMPVKFKFLSEIPHLIFPSLVDSLNNGTENTQLCLGNLENWMNIYVKHPESVVPFLEKNLSKITDFLSNNLLRPIYLNVCLVSLKWLSKLGGKGRNYLEKKKIMAKTCPNQILSMKLKEINSERTMDFVLDNIIDICNGLNSTNKPFHKKNSSLNDKNFFNNFIDIYKNCLAAFFHRKIDYDYIIEVKKNIIEGINFNENEFNSQISFKVMNEKNSRIKINSIFRKIEHFLVDKIITGFFLINSTLTQIQNNNQKELINIGNNNLMDFMSNYFVLILLSKEKNNKNMLLFELDPVIFIDEMIHYLFSTHPTIIRNTNVQFAEYSLKIINYILDSINKLFDYDNEIIKNLEIVDIIYMKLLNCCYVNESQRIDSGLMLLKYLLQKFDKEINHKYLKYFFKCMSSVTSNYTNLVKIQFKKGNHLVEIIDYLINMFIIDEESYSKINEDYLKDNKNIKEDMLSDKEKVDIFSAKKNFKMFFDFIRYCFDEIIEKIDSPNNYTRNLGIYLINKIIGNFPRLKKIIPILYQIDISNLSIIDFYKYMEEADKPIDYKKLIFECNYQKENQISATNLNREKYILKNFNSTKIYKKLDIIFNALTRKLGLRETYFDNLITYSDSLNNIFNDSSILIDEYISNNNNNTNLCLEIIKALYFNILISYYNYCEISNYFKNTDGFKTKLIYLFMEQLLIEKNFEYLYKIQNKEGKEIILINDIKEEYIEYIEKYVYDNEVYRNEVNTRDYLIAELFEQLGLKIKMVMQYIKLLNNIFNKLNFGEKSDKQKEEFNKYKYKTTKLVFIQIFNLHSSEIIKESSLFLYDIFKNKNNYKLKERIYKENYDKINQYIDKINEKDIKDSNCALNQDNNNTALQRDHINALLIICKSMRLDEKMTNSLISKISIFSNYLEDKFENSQFVLFYGYISLFLYIDLKENELKNIFGELLNRIKETILYPSKNLLIFTQTKYHKQIIKLLVKYRHYFSKFLINKCDYDKEHKYIFKLIKTCVCDERGALIGETIFFNIANKIKNEIIIKENNRNESEIEKNLNKLAYLLKICKLISLFSPIFLKKTSLIEIIDDYIKNLIIKYEQNYEKMQENSAYEKVIKYWLDLNKIHIEIFSKKNKYILSLFFFKSMKNMSKIEKNKILIYITYRLCINASDKNSEKKFRVIMNSFIKLDDETLKFFDLFVEYLIIPLLIKHLKNFNYFKCFSVSVNKDNSLKINLNNSEIKKEKSEKEANKEDKVNIQQSYDQEYLINLIGSLCTRLNEIKLDTEKKEEVKYKFLSLIIVIYLEYIRNNDINNDINYKTKIEKIYYTIQTLLSNSPYYNDKEGLGLWRIMLFIDIILFSKLEEKEENIKIIFNFCKNFNDDYNDNENLAYELILPYSKNENIFEKLFLLNYNEANLMGIFNLLKILLKFPKIINKLKESTIKLFLNYIYEIAPRLSKSTLNFKKNLIQIMGLIITYISKQREYIQQKESDKIKVENLPDLEKKVYKVTYKLFELILLDKKDKNDNDLENLEILKKIIIYLRELLNSSTSLQMIISSFDVKTIDKIKFIHSYIQLLRVYSLNLQMECSYSSLKLFFNFFKELCEKNMNYRYINDFMLIIRLLTDEGLLSKLSNKERPNEAIIIEHKLNMMDTIEELIQDKINMAKKYTNYDVKDLFIAQINSKNFIEISESYYKNVKNYLILNKLYIDIYQNFANPQNMFQQNNNQNMIYANQQIPTANTTVETHHNAQYQPQNNGNNPHQMQQQINNIRNIQQTNNINQQINNDKWLESFHINDFKLFIFYRKFVDEFYSSLENTITNLSNINIENNNINLNNIKILKDKLEKKLNTQQKILELIHSITNSFFENFYCFTIFFLKEYKNPYEHYYKKGYLNYLSSINKEIKEYFSTSHNFYFNLRSFEDIQKIKTENIECILNDKEKEKDKDKEKEKKNIMTINNMFIVYPDIILSGFLFFFECKEIVEKYYKYLFELFKLTYRYFRDKFYDPLLEHLLNTIMFNKYLEDKNEEKTDFMFNILTAIEVLQPYKIIRTADNILLIFIKYIKYHLNDPNFNKKDPKIIQSLRIILYNSIKFELPRRKVIYELIKSYIGYNIVDCLKWIFTLDDDGENDNCIYSYIYYESIPYTIDLLLSYFQEGIPLTINTYNFSKFKSLTKFKDDKNDNKMEIENDNEMKLNENDYKKYDKNNYIKNIVDNCNLVTKEKNVEDLLIPIRAIILLDNNCNNKAFTAFFPQLWKMLNMNERESLTVYINEFFYKYVEKGKDKNNPIINIIFDTFSQCSPLVYIKPIIIQSLIPYQNFWSANILYLENLLISGIDIPSTYNSLINIFNYLKENELANGLKFYFSKNRPSKEAFSELQANNYFKAENIFYECFNKFKNDILEKIDINNTNFDDKNILSDDEFEIFNDLSSWENGLIDCYQYTDKWNNIIELSDINNNNDLTLKGLWYCGNDKWKEIDAFTKKISQFNKREKGIKTSYIVLINEIFLMFYKLIEESNNQARNNNDNKYQNICMNCIRNIYQDFNTLNPKNLENINYYYFLIFQLAVESWESMNTLNETLRKKKEDSKCNFKENLLLWRERLPHYCEGIKSLKCILEPRQYLFKILKDLSNNVKEANDPNYTDKVWSDMIFMKYARKLNLTEAFYEKLKLFEAENKNNISIYPYEIYCKDIEYIKFLRNNVHNYDLGIKKCEEYINNFSLINDINEEKIKDFVSYALNTFKRHKAYFNYKKGNIFEAHKLFIDSSIYKKKESSDYHLYDDWAEMCEEISFLSKGEEGSSEWFENTIHNYLYTIIYKLDKAKYIIPRMITFIKEFKNEYLKDRFNEEINEIPPWVWIFWLPILFENFNFYQKDNNKNDFFYFILKKVANKYKQISYYPYSIYQKILNDNYGSESENPLSEKYKELNNIIYSENKYDHCIDKIQLIIDELTKKEKDNQENSLNAILNLCEMLTFKNQKFSEVKNFFENVGTILKNFPDLVQFQKNFEEIMKKSEINRDKLRECVIKNKYYNHNLIVTENKFKKLSKLCEDNIHNIDFNNIELPGYFSNKIEEPTEQNMIYISKFESEYSHKFITDARSKVLIKCSNDKLLNFIIVNQDAVKNIDMKIYMMQILFNFIFAKNFQTYKRKVCFITPIKYHISSKIKIVEEDINIKYNMDEIYEYCLQKRGYSPKIANQIFEEPINSNLNTDLLYYSSENNEKLFYKMCKIIPQDSLKNFIHKFILASEDILLFRKQFAISYSINNLLSFIFLDNIILKNIAFNKETGFCTFNTDLTLFTDNEYKEIIEQKEGTPLRLTKNISYFLSLTSIYGIIPGIFYFSCNALLNKPKILKSILKICLDNNNNDTKIDKIVHNYMNKFKFVLNITDDKEFFDNRNIQRTISKENINENNNNIDNKDKENYENNNKEMKIIYELIENSMNNDNLKKKTIDYEAWF